MMCNCLKNRQIAILSPLIVTDGVDECSRLQCLWNGVAQYAGIAVVQHLNDGFWENECFSTPCNFAVESAVDLRWGVAVIVNSE